MAEEKTRVYQLEDFILWALTRGIFISVHAHTHAHTYTHTHTPTHAHTHTHMHTSICIYLCSTSEVSLENVAYAGISGVNKIYIETKVRLEAITCL